MVRQSKSYLDYYSDENENNFDIKFDEELFKIPSVLQALERERLW